MDSEICLTREMQTHLLNKDNLGVARNAFDVEEFTMCNDMGNWLSLSGIMPECERKAPLLAIDMFLCWVYMRFEYFFKLWRK